MQIDHNIFVEKLSQKAFNRVIDLDFCPQTSPRCVKYTYLQIKWTEAVGTQIPEQRAQRCSRQQEMENIPHL